MVIAVVVALQFELTSSAYAFARQWFSTILPAWPLGIRLAAAVVTVVAAFVTAIVVHELAHVLVGLCCRFRFNSMRIGRLHLTRPFRWSWSRPSASGAAGMASLFPLGTQYLRLRAFLMLASGPLANLATAGVILLLGIEKDAWWGPLLFCSVAVGTINIVPFRRATFLSDGRRLLTLLVSPAEARRWLAVLALTAELNEGIPPESLSSDHIAAALALEDESFDAVAAHMLGYLTRFYQHDSAGAAGALEFCLGQAGHLPDAIRESLMCEAAMFQAGRRARIDLAEAWLADVPPETTIPGIREQAEAAILEARGDRAAARRTLERVEALLASRPDPFARDLTLRLVRRWMARLEPVADSTDPARPGAA